MDQEVTRIYIYNLIVSCPPGWEAKLGWGSERCGKLSMGLSDATSSRLIRLLQYRSAPCLSILDKLLRIASTSGALRRLVGALLKQWHQSGGVPLVDPDTRIALFRLNVLRRLMPSSDKRSSIVALKNREIVKSASVRVKPVVRPRPNSGKASTVTGREENEPRAPKGAPERAKNPSGTSLVCQKTGLGVDGHAHDTSHHSLLTTHRSPITAHHSLPTTNH